MLVGLSVLILDCQTTGPSPERGHLLELAWAPYCARDTPRADAIHGGTVALPDGATLPHPVARLTGITPAELAAAPPAAERWRGLLSEVDGQPAVAHFASFERRFIIALHGGPPPFDLICTHALARRLLPDLPRRSLRALAGYFGHLKPELKRARAHVLATMHIWRGVVDLLAREAPELRTLQQLEAWLHAPAPKRTSQRRYLLPAERRRALPDRPGVYRLLNRHGDLLYLGKAASLRRRVGSYFQRRRAPERTLELVTQVADVDVTPTATALEAALLEADEIKRHAPPYNKALAPVDPRLWYTTADLSSVRSAPDALHQVGPATSREALEALAALAGVLRGAPRGDPRAALGLPRAYWPGPDVLTAGLALFRARYGEPALFQLGARLWRRREEEPEPERARDWSPERVARTLENTARRGTQLLRRAHWLCQLQEADLSWRSAAGAQRRLVVRGGQVFEPRPGCPAPAPRRPLLVDRATHDRLRVLTTELRRLAAQPGSHLRLRLAADRWHDRRALRRRLSWF